MDWPVVKLDDICRIELGKTPSRGDATLWDKDRTGSNIWLSIADLPFNLKPIMTDSKEYISDKGARLCRVIPTGTLIVSFKLSLGRLAYAGKDLFSNEAIAALYIEKNIDIAKDYLYWALTNFDWDKAVGSDIKVKGKTLNKAKLKEILIPLPPIPEQQRIVAILDQAFADIEKARANAEKNLKNARELFDSYLQQVFRGHGADLQEKSLGEIGKVSMCKRILKQQTSDSGDIPFYKIGTFGKAANAFIDSATYKEYKEKYSFPKRGDILISASGTIGRCVIYDGMPAYFQDSNIVWIDNDETLVSNEYLFQFYGICDWNPSKGATISRLYNDDLRKIRIVFPRIAEQKKLARAMIELDKRIKSVEKNYSKKLNSLDELKKSLLQKAFSGELTKTEGMVA